MPALDAGHLAYRLHLSMKYCTNYVRRVVPSLRLLHVALVLYVHQYSTRVRLQGELSNSSPWYVFIMYGSTSATVSCTGIIIITVPPVSNSIKN